LFLFLFLNIGKNRIVADTIPRGISVDRMEEKENNKRVRPISEGLRILG
jgi:hypothetical protein